MSGPQASIFWPVRKAWCELTGGHSNTVLGAYRGEQATHVSLECSRCGKQTRWYRVPERTRQNEGG